jgi:hypothetical protein
MELQMIALAVIALYLSPLLVARWRGLVILAGVLTLIGLGVWYGWVEQQSSSIGAGVTGFIVLLGATAAGLGLLIRGLILWAGWQGARAGLAFCAGMALLVGGVVLLFYGP